MKTLIENTKIITANDILLGHGLVIEDEKIIDIKPLKDIDTKNIDNIVDGKGHYLSPGFIDIHNHGNSGKDFMDGSKESIDDISNFHLRHGVTSFLGTVITNSYENMERAIVNIVDYIKNEDDSSLLGIHLEGPFFSIEKKGAQPDKYIRDMDMNFIKSIVDISKGNLKMVSLAPELEGSKEVIDYLIKNNIKVAMAHSNGNYEEIIESIDMGVSIATHLYNGMRNFNHREPGIVGASLLDDRVFCEIIYDRVHVHDRAVEIALKLKTSEKLILVSDSMRATGLEDGIYELGGQKVIVKNQKARLEDGTLAGSLLTLDRAVYNMIYCLNINLIDAVKMASLTPARAIGIDSYKGSIEVGKDADLLLIDANINIYERILKGNILCLEK